MNVGWMLLLLLLVGVQGRRERGGEGGDVIVKEGRKGEKKGERERESMVIIKNGKDG